MNDDDPPLRFQVSDLEQRPEDPESLAYGGQGWARPINDYETDASSVNWRGKEQPGVALTKAMFINSLRPSDAYMHQ